MTEKLHLLINVHNSGEGRRMYAYAAWDRATVERLIKQIDQVSMLEDSGTFPDFRCVECFDDRVALVFSVDLPDECDDATDSLMLGRDFVELDGDLDQCPTQAAKCLTIKITSDVISWTWGGDYASYTLTRGALVELLALLPWCATE